MLLKHFADVEGNVNMKITGGANQCAELLENHRLSLYSPRHAIHKDGQAQDGVAEQLQ